MHNNHMTKKQPQKIHHIAISKKYQGLPSAVVAKLWKCKHYRDPERTRVEHELREAVLAHLRNGELSKEQDREAFFDSMIRSLPKARRAEWPLVETIVMRRIAEHIQGKGRLERSVSPEELALLTQLCNEFKRKKRASKEVVLEVNDELQRRIYINLVKGLALDVANTMNNLEGLLGSHTSPLLLESETKQLKDVSKVTIILGRK